MLTSQEIKSLLLIEEFLNNNAPHFPITPTRAIQISWFGTVYIKDESQNPTGTHKDRMAREIVNTYREILLAKKEWHHNNSLPIFSIISAWSAAFAIQTQLQKFHLPPLHILVDNDTSPYIIDMLKKQWWNVYMHHFDHKALSGEDILKLTENNDGFDITSNKAFDSWVRFYDRLSYEVLNYCPDIVFVPY